MKNQQQKPVSALKLSLKASQDKSKQKVQSQQGSLPKYKGQFDQDLLLKQRQEYLEIKNEREKEFEMKKKELYGPSSSEEDDVGGTESASEEQNRTSTKEEEKLFRESQKRIDSRKGTKELDCEVYFWIKKGKESWNKQFIEFDDQALLISERSFYLKEIHKIKIIQGTAIKDCNRIKLSCNDKQEIFIGANSKPYRQLPLNYYIFAFVIQQKLKNMGKKLYKCQPPSLPGMPQSLSKNSYNFGKIYKKSSLFGIWEERLIVINKDGIYAYKKFNEKHSMFISGSSLRQIWTRFEVQQGCLVVKVLHGSTKTEFGVPLTECLDRRCWLFSLYQLAFPK